MSDGLISSIASVDATSDCDATFLSLCRALRRAEGFTLLIAVCNQPVWRNRLLDQLDDRLGEIAVRITVPAECDDVLSLVATQLASRNEPRPPSVIHVVGLDTGIRSQEPLHARLRSLNHHREEWREQVPVPIVFWVPEYLLQPLAQQAPDFLDWRSGTFLFLEPLGLTREPTGSAINHDSDLWRMTELERRGRMEQLRQWIDSGLPRRESTRKPEVVRWMLELADHHRRLGELEECLRIARDNLLSSLTPESNPRDLAFTWGLIADVLEARGELDEALRIRREEQLPVFERLGDVHERAVTQGRIADMLMARGELDEALRIRREEELPVYERLGDVRSRAVTLGQIADVLMARGELDEALRIHREEQLPVFELLGDVRERAVTQGKMADVLMARGEFDDALSIRREEELPVYERFGDVRSRAVTQGKIADVLMARGELDEALRIRREEELPVYERLGDVRERAVTLGKIADVLMTRGELDEALRIRREEELPVYERLGYVRERAVTQSQIADVLVARGDLDEAIRTLQQDVLPVFEQLGDVRSSAITKGQIANVLMTRGEVDEALRMRRELLPTLRQLSAKRDLLVAQANLALNLLKRNEPGDRTEAASLLCEARETAERMGLPEARQIHRLQENYGFKT